MLNHPDLHQFRPNVGVLLINRQGLVWLGKRMPSKSAPTQDASAWQLPQGGMDPGETPEETAFRELYEETGVRSARLLVVSPGWLIYEFPPNHSARKKDKWRGQRQKWAVMLFEGEDTEVDLDAHEEREFCAWEWAPIRSIGDRIIGFKKEIYDELIESYYPLAEFIKVQ